MVFSLIHEPPIKICNYDGQDTLYPNLSIGLFLSLFFLYRLLLVESVMTITNGLK
nr:MAG TPA: hypothetical protein [Bacteriophage sp.]